MNLKDRTAEFRTILNSNSHSLYASRNSNHQEASSQSAFITTANQISRSYTAKIPSQLEQLRKLSKNCSLFDEKPQQEFTALSDSLKRHLSSLNRSLQELKSQAPSHPSSSQNRTLLEHQRALLLILQTWIANGFKTLESINEARNEILKAQRSRKDQFGSSLNAPISRVSTPPLPTTAANVAAIAAPTTTTTTPTKQTIAPAQPTQLASPRLRQPTLLDPRLQAAPNRPINVVGVDTDASNKKYDDHVAIDLLQGDQQQALLQEQQEPLLGSLRNRATALTSLESTINELGTIYQQLAHMVSQQGEVVQRIDMNIEDMSFNVERGQGELARYLRRVSSNRLLIAKMFAVLIAFIILMKFIFW